MKSVFIPAVLFLCIVNNILASDNINREERSVEQCCDQLYLSASGILAENQEGVLGIYNYSGIDEFGRPYYMKELFGSPIFLYFKESRAESGGQGWIVGSKLHGASLYMSTRSTTTPFCPAGINGGYDRDVDGDESFSIECHSEVVERDCCFSVWVNSSQDGPIWSNQSVFVGKYDMAGLFNGYPYYHKHQYNLDTFLYYRKQGDLPRDGWALNSILGANFLSVTTRVKSECPDGITVAYDRDIYEDDSVRITCDDFVTEQVLPELNATTAKPAETEAGTDEGMTEIKDSSAASFSFCQLNVLISTTLMLIFTSVITGQ